jgi:hypothetical protein
LLREQFGFTAAGGGKSKTTDAGEPEHRDAFDWGQAFTHIHTGTNLHDTITAVAASFVAAGMSNSAAVERLRSLMTASQAPKDARWRERYNEIPRAVTSARAKFGESAPAQRRPTKIINAEGLQAMTFEPIKWVVHGVFCVSPDGPRYFGGTFLPFNALRPPRTILWPPTTAIGLHPVPKTPS